MCNWGMNWGIILGRCTLKLNKYYDKNGVEIIAGMKIRCSINGEIERTHADESGELGILGAELDDLPQIIHPLTNFAVRRHRMGTY